MFPHTITIYRHMVNGTEDVYHRQTVSGFYVYGENCMSASGKGAEYIDSVVIISSVERAADYGTRWDVKKGDRIVKGVGKDISSFKELPESFTVMSVAENICLGDTISLSSVDNVEMRCK